MIAGIGTDIVEVRRIRAALQRHGARFAGRILTQQEQRPALGDDPFAAYLARQFAAKEAVSKALGVGMREGVRFRTIQVLRLETGAPVVNLLDGARLYAESKGISAIQLSLSDEQHYAVAFAIALGH